MCQTTDGLDTPRCTNAHRAEFAAQALRTFQQACAMDEAIDTAASDLICDLLHLLHANKHDPLLPTLQSALHSLNTFKLRRRGDWSALVCR